jgi:hypothetical protein
MPSLWRKTDAASEPSFVTTLWLSVTLIAWTCFATALFAPEPFYQFHATSTFLLHKDRGMAALL